MTLDVARTRRYLSEFDFGPLFVEELGWDRYDTRLDVVVDGHTHILEGIAEKRGMVAFVNRGDAGVPDRATRGKIERQAARSVHEHLIVYVDGADSTQVWQWVRRGAGRLTAAREHVYQRGQSGEALVQKLDALAFSLDEEAGLSIVDVTRRARVAFDVERITRRFYDRFKAEHDAFLGFISGLDTQEDLEWYASVTLNRLMFIYFIQKKGFLDGDRDYLRNRLHRLQQQAGRDQFHSFYRHFLRRLFHEGLGTRKRTSELDALLGTVPYLNGGLFDVHELETAYPDITIPDEGFERLFDFFDSYQWYLDDRPLRADNEVNPDVLGYIFEKYVNQKQMGAYYTKEDITGYITANTLIPRLLEKLTVATPEFSFDAVTRLLASDPERYINVSLAFGAERDLPEEIENGISNVAARSAWNSAASDGYALQRTETWREVVERRARYQALTHRLQERDLASLADLVTLNLNLQRIAEDVIEQCASPTLLLAIYRTLGSLSILDPTCGSGAFLFAALNILEPLYEAAIDRMEAINAAGSSSAPEGEQFRAIIERARAHPTRALFVLKTIVVNNLYGVDILEEAVEICKLRLFLRLVSQIDRIEELEPLPDIDFNVRAGNTLVGEATAADVRTSFEERADGQRKLVFTESADAFDRFEKHLTLADTAFRAYRDMQIDTYVDEDAVARAKHSLRQQLVALANQLNVNLAEQYGVNAADDDALTAWTRSHQPFHWFAEFYPIMSRDGFDVIIGNPPYVEYTQVAGTYTVRDDAMISLGNLHAMVTARCLELLGREGAMAMVVPVALPSTNRFVGLRDELLAGSEVWVSHYDFRPSKLFEGAEQRLTIFVRHRAAAPSLYSTRFNRWYAEERPRLFPSLNYTRSEGEALRTVWPKLAGELGRSVLSKVARQERDVASVVAARGSAALFYKNTGMLYFTMFTRRPPQCFINGKAEPSSRETQLRMRDPATLKPMHALLNSSLFYVMYEINSNCRDLNPSDIQTFRFPASILDDEALEALSDRLEENHEANSEMRVRMQRQTGEVRLQSFKPALSKPIIDEIDEALARHYSFTDSELDFVINYDVKYRIGRDVVVVP